MSVKIDTIPLGIGNGYIIRDEGVIMVDAGAPGKIKEFLMGVEKISLTARDVQLIIMTHGHFDHIGTAADIKEATGASVAMHQDEKDWLEKGLKPVPPGLSQWGSVLVAMMKLLMVPFMSIPSTKVEMVLDDNEVSLTDFGIPGKIIHTPGHSSGSVSVLLETGDVFVGDLAMNALPMRMSPGLPVFGDNMEIVQKSWQMLLEQGAKTVYPAHGKPFPADIIEQAIK